MTPPHASMSAVALSCGRCGAHLGRLCRDGLGVALRNPDECIHHPDGAPLDVQQAVWRAWEDWLRTNDMGELERLYALHDIASHRIP